MWLFKSFCAALKIFESHKRPTVLTPSTSMDASSTTLSLSDPEYLFRTLILPLVLQTYYFPGVCSTVVESTSSSYASSYLSHQLLSGGYLNFVWRVHLRSTGGTQRTTTTPSNSSSDEHVSIGSINSNTALQSTSSPLPPSLSIDPKKNNRDTESVIPYPQHVSPPTIIVKYHPPYIATKPDIPFSSERSAFEGYVLSLFSNARENGTSSNGGCLNYSKNDHALLRIPRLYLSNSTISCLFMEDAGDLPTLEQWLHILIQGITRNIEILPSSICQSYRRTSVNIGNKIGTSLATIHGSSFINRYHYLHKQNDKSNPYGILSNDQILKLKNTSIQIMRKNVQYMNVAKSLRHSLQVNPNLSKTLPLPEIRLQTIHKRCEELGEWLVTKEGFVLIHGDFWLRSVLLYVPSYLPASTTDGTYSTNDGIESTNTIKNSNANTQDWLIDWELAHWGNPAQDIGHFAAHVWMMKELCVSVTYSKDASFISGAVDTESLKDNVSYNYINKSLASLTALFGKLDSYMQQTNHPFYELYRKGEPNHKQANDNDSRFVRMQNTKAILDILDNLWSSFLSAYRTTLAKLFTDNHVYDQECTKEFLTMWSEHNVENFSCVHMGCEISARIGTFFDGGVYDPSICKLDKNSPEYHYYILRALQQSIALIES